MIQVDFLDTRRTFLKSGALLGAAALVAPAAFLACAETVEKVEVTAPEGLMREHGVLQRLLLIFEEIARRLKCCQEFPPEVLKEAVSLTRAFVQDHHEKAEEELLFPQFEKAGKLVALVKILRGQHEAGRKVMDRVAQYATPGTAGSFVQRAQLEAFLNHFSRMSRPHAAQEDTVLFPACRGIVSPGEFVVLGKKLADLEQTRLGQDGSEKILAQVTDLEKALALQDLEGFTPRL